MLALMLLSAAPAGADYETGQRAWEAGQRDVAIAEWRAGANAGEAQAMLALGRLYLRGVGLPQNYVQAHKWFNLAASRGEDVAAAERDALVAQMTAEERVEAQKLALEWQPSEAPARAQTVPAPTGQSGMIRPRQFREVQGLLATLGYQPGPADGAWGEADHTSSTGVFARLRPASAAHFDGDPASPADCRPTPRCPTDDEHAIQGLSAVPAGHRGASGGILEGVAGL